jgi:uncharacterized protein YcbX
MKIATLTEIHRYPVKSMQGERLASCPVATDGLRGDRGWATRDEVRGGIEGARKLPSLLGCTARYVEPVPDRGPLPVPEIELPGGARLRADAPEAAPTLSKHVDRELTLWPRQPAEDLAHYRRGAPDHKDLMDELRAVFGRLPEEPLPDIGSFPRDSRFDPLRFRPNLLLESEEREGFPESAWVGKRVRVGDAVLRIAMECPRCVMTTHAVADLPRDPGVMRALVKENAGNIGVYAAVETPGTVREGEAVELIG